MLCAAQALDIRGLAPSPAATAVRDILRSRVPAMPSDRELAPQIEAAVELLPELVGAAGDAIGGLK
jgi:histidine ammonia-lyase